MLVLGNYQKLYWFICIHTQAIALSLQDSAGSGVGHRPSQCSDVVNVDVNERKGESQIQEDTGRRKRKKSVCYLKRKMLHLFPLCPYLIVPFVFLWFVSSSLLVGCRWQRMSWFCTSISLMVNYYLSCVCGVIEWLDYVHYSRSGQFKERQWVVAHLYVF